MVLTEEEFLEWKQQDVTKEFFKSLSKFREDIKENMVNDLYENDSFAKGKAMVLRELLDMKYDEMREVLYGK